MSATPEDPRHADGPASSDDRAEDDRTEDSRAADERAAREARDEQVGRVAQGIGRTLGRFARKARPEAERLVQRAKPEAERLVQRARPEAERLAQRAKPEAERLAQKARIAAQAATPHVQRAGQDAIRYAREHEDEIKRAALTGAEFTARRAVPLPLRPIVDAVEADRRRRPPLTDDRAPQLPTATEDAPRPSSTDA